MKDLEQRKTAYVADKNRTARSHYLDCALDNAHQVIDTREILYDGVEDDDVVMLRFQIREIIRSALQEFVIGPVRFDCAQLLPQISQCLIGEIRGQVLSAMWCKTEE